MITSKQLKKYTTVNSSVYHFQKIDKLVNQLPVENKELKTASPEQIEQTVTEFLFSDNPGCRQDLDHVDRAHLGGYLS